MMVRLPRKNLPSAEFRQVDVRSFSASPPMYDAICTCFFPSSDPTDDDIRQVIRHIYTWLKEGGWFLFATVPGDVQETRLPWLGQVVFWTTMSLDD